MNAYTVAKENGSLVREVYHGDKVAAIRFFLMGGSRMPYIGNMMRDWDNYKNAGWKIKKYMLKEVR